MALITEAQIKDAILDELEQFDQSDRTSEQLDEIADGWLPIYYSDIVAEWTELPSDDSNQFGEILTPDENSTIYSLMSADLFLYYRRKFYEVFTEMMNERESEQD